MNNVAVFSLQRKIELSICLTYNQNKTFRSWDILMNITISVFAIEDPFNFKYGQN